jgi:hypothetical protein
MAIDGDRLTALLWKRIATWRLDDPLKPTLTGDFPYEERTFGLTAGDGNYYVSVESGIRVLRVEGDELRQIGEHKFAPSDRPTALVWDGDYLVASMYRGGIYRFDVSDPTAFKVMTHFRARRADRPVAVDGVVFAVVMSRGLVAVDMRESARRPIIEHGPMVTGDGSLLRMGDHLLLGQPSAGAALYHSPLLVRCREEAEARETVAARLAGKAADLPVLQELADLCVKQGQSRLAAAYFDQFRELGGDNKGADALTRQREAHARNTADFEAAIERQAFTVETNRAGNISLLRVNEPAALLAHLPAIHALPDLAFVDLNAAVTKAHLEAIQSLRITSLAFHGDGLAAADYLPLARLETLYRLDLSDSSFDDAAMAYLENMTKLRDLDLRNTQVTEEGVAGLRARFIGTLIHFGVAEQQQEEARPQPAPALPNRYRFQLAGNQLLLLHAEDGHEIDRVHPGEAFDAPDLQLTAIAPQEKLCWVGTNAGLMRFDPITQVWSRFAIHRSHLDVPIDTLEIADGKLTVTFAAESAVFDLETRRWLAQSTPQVANSAAPTAPAPSSHFPLLVLVITAIVLLLAAVLIFR